jgi:hypothetical protein
MKNTVSVSTFFMKGILSLGMTFFMAAAMGQYIPKKTTGQPFTDTVRHYQLPVNKNARYSGPKDSVTSFNIFLETKADCDVVKTIDDDGIITIRYPDGFTKIIYSGKLTEIITSDGVHHVLKYHPYNPSVKLAVIQIPPPVPGPGDPIFLWLSKFNSDLEKDIRVIIGGGDDRWGQFLSNENNVCGGNIYKQIQFRTSFLENYGTAH